MEYLLTHESETDRHIPVLRMMMNGGNPKARVIVMHGLGATKEGVLADLFRLAQVGFEAVAIDARLHGERPDSAGREALLDADFAGGMQQVIYGTAEDVSYLLDAWGGEAKSTGFIGISAGGMVGHVLAVGEKRFGAMASLISSPDWLTADPTNVPDPNSPAGQMLAAISPVNHAQAYAQLPILMMNGDVDEVVTHFGSVLLEERLSPIYASAGYPERLSLTIFPGLGHVYLHEMQVAAVAWMQRFLL